MCTLVVAAHVVPEFPLLVVANRDEQRGRPSSPPFRWADGFVAPRDEVAGGSWLGFGDRGLFVGITNRFLGPRDPTRASRGELVTRALRSGTARDIHTGMASVDPSRFNGFHLVYADATGVFATVSDGQTLAQLTLGKGLSIVTERSFGAGGDERRVARIRARWSELTRGPFALERATELLDQHDETDPLAATCIHLDQLDYGTRSAMVLGASGTRARMLWAEGPPCTTTFVPVPMV